VIGTQQENWVEKRRRYVQTLREILAPFDVLVVMVLRRQDDFARSMYQEYINVGPRAIRRWAGTDLREKSQRALSFLRFRKALAKSQLQYLLNLMLFEEAFGRPEVLLFNDLINTGKLPRAFFEELGVNTEDLTDPGEVKRSPSYEKTLMKKKLWKLAPRSRPNEWMNRFAKWTAEAVIHPYFSVSHANDLWENESARTDFMEIYSDENAKIASRYFPRRSIPLFD